MQIAILPEEEAEWVALNVFQSGKVILWLSTEVEIAHRAVEAWDEG